MGLKSASAAIVVGCALMLSACETAPMNQAGYGGYEDSTVAIGDASATLIAAVTDPCKLNPRDLYWAQHGGGDGYEQRCGRLSED